MGTPTIDLIHKHGSVRNYKPDPLDRDIIKMIVHAGQKAATSSNLQLYSVVVTQELAERRMLQEWCGNQGHISQAPVFLTWCADLSRIDRICSVKNLSHQSGYVENFLLAAVDASIAAQNAALAAESIGLGFCYIGAIRNKPRQVIELLKLPQLVFPLFGMTVGWPISPPTVRPRLPLNAVLHWGHYDTSGEEELWSVYDKAMIQTGIYEGRQVSTKENLPVSQYGWTDHSARRVSQVMRPHLRKALLEQGFDLN